MTKISGENYCRSSAEYPREISEIYSVTGSSFHLKILVIKAAHSNSLQYAYTLCVHTLCGHTLCTHHIHSMLARSHTVYFSHGALLIQCIVLVHRSTYRNALLF